MIPAVPMELLRARKLKVYGPHGSAYHIASGRSAARLFRRGSFFSISQSLATAQPKAPILQQRRFLALALGTSSPVGGTQAQLCYLDVPQLRLPGDRQLPASFVSNAE